MDILFTYLVIYKISEVIQTRNGNKTFSKTAETTSIILSFFNDLFDSFNGNKGQGLSSVLTSQGGHISFWKEACNKLRTMQFVDKNRQIIKKNKPICLKNWIWTIKAAQEIWRILQNANFETFNLKFLNQDVIENFFSQIRNFSSNRNPNPKQFEEAFKALLICNMTSKHSFGANCMEDNFGDSLALSQFINFGNMACEKGEVNNNQETEQATIPQTASNEIAIDPDKIKIIISSDINVIKCPICFNNLNNPELLSFIRHVTAKLEIKFIEICCEPKVAEKTQKILQEEQYLLPLLSQCTHLTTILFTSIAHEFIKTWCTFINNILCKKTIIESDNYMYNIAKRMSTKYTKKISENKIGK